MSPSEVQRQASVGGAGLAASLAGLAVAVLASEASALRANLRGDLGRLEQLGHYEEVLFYRCSTRDMVLAIHCALAGMPYDPQMDRLFGETRVDRRYWNLVNGQKRPITELLAKAKLTEAQLERLNERVRVYVEDHLSPDFEEMGNFYFRRKAMVMEQTGLFAEASFRRRLTGYYILRACVPYYATMAQEFEQNGQKASATACQAKAEWWRQQAEREFRRSNGDRLLGQMQGEQIRDFVPRDKVLAFLRGAVTTGQPDARHAAVLALADMGEVQAATAAAEAEQATRSELAETLAWTGLPVNLPAGARRGIRARYFTDPQQQRPAAEKVLPAADIGLTGNERFPQKFRPHWTKPTVFPPGAAGQFMVVLEGKLSVPADGKYRFYIKTDNDNRATVRVAGQVVISPRNDRQLLYAVQTPVGDGASTRVDFSLPVELKAGPADLAIEYRGAEAKGKFGPPGLRLYWSSERFVMEPVPPGRFFCEGN